MLALKLVQPGQQQVAPKVRRCRQLQDAADLILTAGQQTPAFVEMTQGRPSVLQKTFAFCGQAQAAGRAGQQAGAQLLFDALQRRARHCCRHVHAPCGRGQAAQVRRTDEQLQIIEPQHVSLHYQKKIERDCSFSGFYLP
ncbi:hypothetical protein D3C76_1216940 [compost metagenome]